MTTVLCLVYLLLLPPFTGYMRSKQYEERLGYLPRKELVGCLAADQRQLVASLLMIEVIYYFGGYLEKRDNKLTLPLDYRAMAGYLRTVAFLDPYNSDVYYFTQASYSDSVKGARFANELLETGMKYRTWDPELPFFAGFNAAFTLKDYKKAAGFMKRAGEITGDPLYVSLAAKFFNEAGETDFGILFMELMEKNAKDEKIRRLYRDKKDLLIAVREIKNAVNLYVERNRTVPRNLEELRMAGLLKKIPRDPFGGKLYLTPRGTVESTSGSLAIRTD
jgi:hypothetical protein